VRGRFEAAAAAGALTSFVGREDELRALMSRWERVLDGEGQVALIIGEAGIGKSRLVQRFHEKITGTPHTWIEASAGPFFQNTPFYPVAEMLRQALFAGGNGPPDAIEQLGGALTHAGLNPVEAVPLIASLLNLPLPAGYPLPTLSPEVQRRRLLATLVEWVIGSARAQPLVIAIEDLHWVDPSTLELIQLLVEQGAIARLLLVYTARPEFRAPWTMRAHHAQITLNRLGARDVRTIVAEVAASKVLSDETVTTVVERTGGVPLFVEELTRAVLETGKAKVTERAIPVTLHDSLMARLDRLGPAKDVAQVGAVIGSEFSYELLHAVHPIAEAELQAALRKLAEAELVYARGIAPDATYTFKHALIRDAAYEALLKSRRKDLHFIVARAINDKFPGVKAAHLEVLARHWTEAGETERAIVEWEKAGAAAEARNAYREALENYQQVAALLDALPESSERDSHELELGQSVYRTLYIVRGHAARETIDNIDRTAALARKTGKLTLLTGAINRRGFAAYFSGDLPGASALADQALEFALRDGSHTVLASAHFLQIATRYLRGDLVGAERHVTVGLKFFDDPGFRQSPGAAVAALSNASLIAWTLGRADLARERANMMMAAANPNNPYDVASSDLNAANLRFCLREYKQAEALAARALALFDKHQFSYFAGSSRCVLGSARAQLNCTTEGIALIREAMAALQDTWLRSRIEKLFFAHLAAAEERAGKLFDALQTIGQALPAYTDELVFRPEILRLRGEIQFKRGQMAQADADFRAAIALAQTMSAKAWELRATMSLARLFATQGRRDEARTMLANIYGWFTEGFDTADLKDAKALLDELGA
jgi:tetratricopeptide (TPR) repeat protein